MREAFAESYAEKRARLGSLSAYVYATSAIADAIGSGIIERVSGFARNAAYAVRQARKSPGLSAVIVGTIAIAIGANVAVDSELAHVYLSALPFNEPETLVTVWEANAANGITGFALSYDDAVALRTQMSTARIAFISSSFGTLLGTGIVPRALSGINVSGEFFDVLKLKPELGRLLTADDEARQSSVVVISDELWHSAFNADPHVIGRPVTIADRRWIVVGVVPAHTYTPDRWGGGVAQYAYYAPMTPRDRTAGHLFRVIGRRTPGTDLRAIDADLDRIFSELVRTHPQTDGGFIARAHTVRDDIFGRDWIVASIVAGVVFLVLAIACANVANLFLARGSARAGELAIRISLGASRKALVEQLFTESALFVITGSVLGIGLAALCTPALDALTNGSFSFAGRLTVDTRTLAITFGIIAAAVLLAGLAPAQSLSRSDLSIDLKRAGRGGALNAGSRLRALLIAIEVAAAIAVVLVAGLTLRTLDTHLRAPLGYEPEHRYLVAVNGTSEATYGGTSAKQLAKQTLFLRSLAAIPGVESVAATMSVPNYNNPDTSVTVEGRHYAHGSEPEVKFNIVSSQYFHVMSVPIELGRSFDDRDRLGSAPVAIVNRAFAETYFGSVKRALGQRIVVGFTTGGQPIVPRTIVGVAGDVRENVQYLARVPVAYLDASQMPTLVGSAYFVVHANIARATLASTVQAAISQIDSRLPHPNVTSLQTLLERNIYGQRIVDFLLGGLAIVALLLALGGVIAVIAYSVERRTHEIGIRLALGASRASVILLVMRTSLWPVTAGVAVGLALGALGAHALDGQLIDGDLVRPLEEACLVGFVALLIALAAYLPAQRAARVDPLTALRYE